MNAAAELIESLASELWRYHCVTNDPRGTDVIVGLGSYDLRVADHCAQLFANGVAPMVVFSGNRGNWTSSLFDEPEAQIFARRAQSLGVPPEKIMLEAKSTNLGENLAFTRALMESKSIAPKSVTFVTKGNTLRRVRATAAVVWPQPEVSLQCPRRQWKDQPPKGITRNGLIAEMVGDLHRIIVYAGLGFQAPQSIPLKVRDAYRQFVLLGFDGHLVPGHAAEPGAPPDCSSASRPHGR